MNYYIQLFNPLDFQGIIELNEEYDFWKTIELKEKHKTLISQYWKHIPHDKNYTNSFWYPNYIDLKYLKEEEYNEEDSDSMRFDSADSYDWSYYNDGLDMDQQDERFWNF